MDNKRYVGGKEVSEILGVHQITLYQCGGKRMDKCNKNIGW